MPQTTFTPASFATIAIPATTKAQKAAIRRGLFKAANLGKARVVEEIQNAKPRPAIDTGELARSYKVLRYKDGWVLRSMAKHAVFMEFGTKPHAAPMAPLLEWAKRKMRGIRKIRRSQAKKRQQGKRQERRPGRAGASVPSAKRQEAAKRRAAQRKKQRELEDRAFAKRAWVAILKRGTEARHFHGKASQDFAKLAAKWVKFELSKPLKAAPEEKAL
jgi:hypothetical protein